jgi:hypothetical protein
MDNPGQLPTPYPELNQVLAELVGGVQSILGASFIGAYLQGSFAVGDFDQHSDVDFIIVTDGELSGEQAAALQSMHGRIYDLECPYAQHLEGSYFPQDVLRSCSQAGKPLWYLDHGARSLVRENHCNTILVRWVVREHGVRLAGPDPAGLVEAIPVKALQREILSSMNGWGQEILANPEQYNNRFYQGFIVLHYCRALHDLVNGYPGSKRAGAEWAKANLDPSWRGLIDRAWDCRHAPAVSVRQPADADDLRRTLEFVAYVIAAANSASAGWLAQSD